MPLQDIDTVLLLRAVPPLLSMAEAGLKYKVYRRQLVDEFRAHLAISTVVEIYMRFGKKDIADVWGHVIEILHRRIDDDIEHPKSAEWSDSFIVKEFSMFADRAEWKAYFLEPKNSGQNLAAKTPADVGILPAYATFGKAVWLKVARMKAHIINVVNVDFKKLLARGKIKTGESLSGVVEALRRQYYAEWATTTDGRVTHLMRPIEEVPDYTPGPWWGSWKLLGPPAGTEACDVLMDISSQV